MCTNPQELGSHLVVRSRGDSRTRGVLAVVAIALISVSGLALYQQARFDEVVENTTSRITNLESQVGSLQESVSLLTNQSGINPAPTSGVLALGDIYVTGQGPWSVVVPGFNGESSSMTVTGVEVDGVPFYGIVSPGGVPLTVGARSPFALSFELLSEGEGSYSPGQILQVKVLSSGGYNCSQSVTLPKSYPILGYSLALSAYEKGGTVFVIVRNYSMWSVFIEQVVFNDTPLAPGACEFFGGFIEYCVYTFMTGTLSFPASGGKSGETYPVTLVTSEAGNCTTYVTWP
jgi:hypothetical protein